MILIKECTELCFKFFREAARECRRKKKEYIKCLENRVAVLENRNQTLIDELKSLKELYQQKADWGWYLMFRYRIFIKPSFNNESAHMLTVYIIVDVVVETKIMCMHL